VWVPTSNQFDRINRTPAAPGKKQNVAVDKAVAALPQTETFS
jgi:hypothetical protein